VNAYTITFAGCVLLGGRIADLIGHRNAFIAGAALFALASLAGGLAPDALVLAAARAAQGVGAALLSPATLTLLTSGTEPGPERSKALGLWGAMSAAGGAVGSVVGGVVVDLSSWQWVFLINVPFAAFAAVGALRWIPEGVRRTSRRPDVLGAAAVTLGLGAIVYAIVTGSEHGWTSTSVIVSLATGLLLVAAFVLVETQVASEPLVPPALLQIKTLVTANLVGVLAGAGGVAMWYFITLYEQEVLGMSPTAAGLGFLPHTISIMVAARLSGRLLATVEPRRLMAGGLLLTTVGFVAQSFASADGTYWTDVLVPGVLICFGAGLSFPAIAQVATTGVPATEAGLASGVLNTSRWFGGSLGLAAFAALAAARTESLGGADPSNADLVAGYDVAFLAAAGITLGAAALVVFVPRTAGGRALDGEGFAPGEPELLAEPATTVLPEPA
jgi:EmrB/QacA subfamily drug resistance transporter